MKKKKIVLFTLLPILLGSCSQNNTELSIICPTGGPSICFYSFYNNNSFETTSNPQTGILPMFFSNTYDVIVAPTQGGLLKIVKENAPFQIASTITFGNFYLVATGHDDNTVLDNGDNVLIFQENDVPGRTFKYTYNDIDLNITSVDNAAMTKNVIENGGVLKAETTITFDYIMTAEPILTATKSTIFRNVQTDFYNKSGYRITQASIFVRKGINKSKIDTLLTKLKTEISAGIENPQLIYDNIAKIGSNEAQQGKYGTTAALAKKICLNNGFSLGYEKAYDIKTELQNYMSLFPQLGIGELNEEIFYK